MDAFRGDLRVLIITCGPSDKASGSLTGAGLAIFRGDLRATTCAGPETPVRILTHQVLAVLRGERSNSHATTDELQVTCVAATGEFDVEAQLLVDASCCGEVLDAVCLGEVR